MCWSWWLIASLNFKLLEFLYFISFNDKQACQLTMCGNVLFSFWCHRGKVRGVFWVGVILPCPSGWKLPVRLGIIKAASMPGLSLQPLTSPEEGQLREQLSSDSLLPPQKKTWSPSRRRCWRSPSSPCVCWWRTHLQVHTVSVTYCIFLYSIFYFCKSPSSCLSLVLIMPFFLFHSVFQMLSELHKIKNTISCHQGIFGPDNHTDVFNWCHHVSFYKIILTCSF